MCESFFGTLEAELLLREHFRDPRTSKAVHFLILGRLVQRTPPA